MKYYSFFTDNFKNVWIYECSKYYITENCPYLRYNHNKCNPNDCYIWASENKEKFCKAADVIEINE